MFPHDNLAKNSDYIIMITINDCELSDSLTLYRPLL